MILFTIVKANLLQIVERSCYPYYAKFKYVNFDITMYII